MISVKCEIIDPLHLAETHTVAPMARTLEYIPGSAWRGALAAEYLRHSKNKADARFSRFFLSEGCVFTALNFCGQFLNDEPGQPLPATTYTCKAHPGWNSRGDPDSNHHGTRDMLFEYNQSDTKLPVDTCEKTDCGAKLVPYSGFYSPYYGKMEVSKRVITHSALDSRSETAAPRQLYSQEVIEESQYFAGEIRLLSEADEEAFQKDYLPVGQEFRLGAGKSRGQGLIRIVKSAVKPDTQSDRQAVLVKQIGKFTQKSGLTGSFFTILLHSDCILLDSKLNPTIQIMGDHLAQFCHPALKDSKPLAQFCRADIIDGWNMAHHLPRPASVAIRAGGVFSFQSNIPVEKLAEVLIRLEREGLGERRQEGFGRVEICSDFHLWEDQR